jgi:LytS/YehU family sensor histidine kinase
VQLRSEKLETELKFLRNQTNPHFLFNALNNIYTLTLIKSEKAPDYLLILSDMLRYMLYECNAPRVKLEKEIGYIRHFIDLNLLKDSRGLNVHFACEEIPENLEIAPMLLIPLVENAFKHSKFEDKAKGWIDINLQVSGESLHLNVRNSLPGNAHTTDKTGGIGLANVRRQLELIYPNESDLTVEEQDQIFSVTLNILKLS